MMTEEEYKDLKLEIKKLEDQLYSLKREKTEYLNSVSKWYVGWYVIGDGDYWDEYYVPLGCMTKSQANTELNKFLSKKEEVDDFCVREVDDTTYKIVCALCDLDKILPVVNLDYTPLKHYVEDVDVEGFRSRMINKKKELFSKIKSYSEYAVNYTHFRYL